MVQSEKLTVSFRPPGRHCSVFNPTHRLSNGCESPPLSSSPRCACPPFRFPFSGIGAHGRRSVFARCVRVDSFLRNTSNCMVSAIPTRWLLMPVSRSYLRGLLLSPPNSPPAGSADDQMSATRSFPPTILKNVPSKNVITLKPETLPRMIKRAERRLFEP